METTTKSDHTHECRGCGASIDCYTPNDECNDHPGDCAQCVEGIRAPHRTEGKCWHTGEAAEACAAYRTRMNRGNR